VNNSIASILFGHLPESSRRRCLFQASPTAAMVMTYETKISHFFKQLTLSVAAHFVNSLPLVTAHMPKTAAAFASDGDVRSGSPRTIGNGY